MSDPLKAYQTLQRRLDEFFAHAREQYPDAMRCNEGCADCCDRDLSLFPFEARLICEATENLEPGVRALVLERAQRAGSDDEMPCPLLMDDTCLIYPARSIICRTHGLPSLFRSASGERELSLCPYNFKGAEHVNGDCVLDLEPVNSALATINHLLCGEMGVGPERIRISRALLDHFGDGEFP